MGTFSSFFPFFLLFSVFSSLLLQNSSLLPLFFSKFFARFSLLSLFSPFLFIGAEAALASAPCKFPLQRFCRGCSANPLQSSLCSANSLQRLPLQIICRGCSAKSLQRGREPTASANLQRLWVLALQFSPLMFD